MAPRRLFIALTAILIGFPVPVFAADNAAALEALQQQLAIKQKSQAQLNEELKDAAASLKETQAQLVAHAASVHDSEQAMQKIEAQTAVAIDAEAALQRELQADTNSMGDLVLALTRLRRLPPELLIVRPEAPLQTAETATLLGAVLPNLNQRTDAIAANIRQLKQTQAALAADRAREVTARAALDKKYQDVTRLTAQRTALYQKLNSDFAQTQADVATISGQAHNLQDLIDRLAKARADADAKAAAKAKVEAATAAKNKTLLASRQPAEPSTKAYHWTMPSPGHPQLPVAGRILTGYGERDKIGALSQGITMMATPGALAVAPMGGVVRYAGPFKSYGHLVMLEHEGGYISLIAGLDSVDAATGQSLQAGEPLGKLPGTSSRTAAPALYYELRYHGQPINPAEKFPDLKLKS